MAITRDFTFQEDDDSGLSGLRPSWMPNANPTTAVAHDILEHFLPKGLTAAEDEFIALGALLALRIENGSFSPHNSYGDQLVNVVFSVIADIERDELPIPREVRTRALSDMYSWAEGAIQYAVPKAIEMAQRELGDDDIPPRVFQDTKELRNAIIGYLRLGYRKAHRRYQDCDMYGVANGLFKKLDKLSKQLSESEYLSFGDRIRFVVHPRSGDVNIKVNGRCAEALGLI